jgi:hypothetical protein
LVGRGSRTILAFSQGIRCFASETYS